VNAPSFRLLAGLAARYLLRRRLRTTLTSLAVVFGVGMVFGLGGVLPAFQRTFERSALAAAGEVDLSLSHETGEAFDARLLEQLRALPGVRTAGGVLRRTVAFPARSEIGAVQLTGVEVAGPQVRARPVSAGRFLQAEDAGRAVAVIDDALARKARLAPGGELLVPAARGTLRLEVVGVASGPSLPGQLVAFAPLDVVQRAVGLEGRINLVEVMVEGSADRKAVEAAALGMAGAGFQAEGLLSEGELFAGFRSAQATLNFIGLMALFMGGFLILNTFRTSVAERRRDIGMLRAVGASRRSILGLVLLEGVLQGVAGTALGMGLGYLFATGMLRLMGRTLRDYMQVEVPVTPEYSAGDVVGIALLGLLVTAVAALWPAWTAARVQPMEALRPATAEHTRRSSRASVIAGLLASGAAVGGLVAGGVPVVGASSLLFLVGLVLLTPVVVRPLTRAAGAALSVVLAREGRLAEATLHRQPGRASITASALMIGLAVAVAATSTVSSVQKFFASVLDDTMRADFVLLPPSIALWGGQTGAAPELAGRLAAVEGVGKVASMRYALGSAREPAGGTSTPISMMGVDPVAYPEVAGLTFVQGEPAEAYRALAAGDSVLVTTIGAKKLKLQPGDTLEVGSPAGPRRYRVAGIVTDFMSAKIVAAFLSQAALAADFGRQEDLVLHLRMAEGAAADEVRPRLEAVLREYPQFTLHQTAAWRAQQERSLRASMAVISFLLIILLVPAVLGLVNTLAINVLERTREIGVLRAIGATRRQVKRMVLGESLLLAAAGSACGLVAGLWLGHAMVVGIRGGMGFLVYAFPAAGALAAVAFGLGIGVVAAVLPARQAARVPIVKALQYE
jgi:putative ABC transport system permease protein